ncbi:Clathrin light chain 2 [Zea mays]|uniref:Clathrin light chain 2 n=1 Tax=Zea mays TaxID=4577 RepID=A0A1D6GXA5_MAIZE|nr:Clathrin light chain 2 [Zea mays]
MHCVFVTSIHLHYCYYILLLHFVEKGRAYPGSW